METKVITITVNRRVVRRHVATSKRRGISYRAAKTRNRFMEIITCSIAMIFILTAFIGAIAIDVNATRETPPPKSTVIDEPIPLRYITATSIKHETEELQASAVYYSSGALRDIEDPPVVEEIPSKSDQEIITDCMGDTIIELSENTLVRMDLPDVYYPGIDFTSSQPYEDYSCITNRRSAAYQITRSDNAYTDENGYRRYTTTDNQFTIDGESDYVVALGTFYKPKGTCGSRFLVITSEGMYTIITGDEKDDRHTDEMNMFSRHGDNAGMIEFLVDSSTLYHADNMAARMGSIHYSSIPELSGEILAMYRID